MKGSYASAGVDRDAAKKALGLIKKHARSTHQPEVLGDLGFFGGLFQLKGYEEPVLVSSADGVGTKLKIAFLMGRHHTVGADLVNHCVNDILTCGATPLFFLDYIAMGRLVPQQVEEIIEGMAKACRSAGCALIGGETAEMPGLYAQGDYDLVGFIVGGVEKKGLIDGSSIAPGDVLLGLPSNGLHTNGYSLVRKVFDIKDDRSPLDAFYPELGRTLGEELLETHLCYYSLLKPALPWIKGMAHITGGGLLENVPRILPPGLSATIERGAWPIPPIFSLIQKKGTIEEEEMYRVFNMGVGMVLVCSPSDVEPLMRAVPGSRAIGEVVKRKGDKPLVLF